MVREHEHELSRLGCQELCVEPEELRVVEIAVGPRPQRVEDDEPETRLRAERVVALTGLRVRLGEAVAGRRAAGREVLADHFGLRKRRPAGVTTNALPEAPMPLRARGRGEDVPVDGLDDLRASADDAVPRERRSGPARRGGPSP